MAGIKAVNSTPSHTMANPQIQQAVQQRVSRYPESIRKHQHIAHAYVPVGVAALLREYPTLVAPAVTAFAERDLLDNRALRVMRHFPPEQRVLTAVRFSKALYARVMSSQYTPDRRTGWNLPPPNQPDHKTHSLGVKLACGFELLVCNAGGITPSPPPSTKDDSTPISVTTNPRWGKYKKALTEKGYFRGELEGSRLYKELETSAVRYFSQHLQKVEGSERGMDALTAGTMVVKLLPAVNADPDFFRERQQRLVPADDDSWLNISPDLLDEMLETQYGTTADQNNGNTDQELQSGLETFLKTSSDFEGAEISPELQEQLRKLSTMSLPRKKQSLRPETKQRKVSMQQRKISSLSTASNSSQMSSLSNKVELNADAFSDAYMHCMEKFFADDDYFRGSDDDSSGLSSYGESDDEEDPSRKISSGSGASSGIEGDMRGVMREMEEQLRATTVGEHLSQPQDEDDDDDDDDEFDDVEDFEPVKVDKKTVEKLVQSYKAERGGTGPATTLFSSLGIKPQ